MPTTQQLNITLPEDIVEAVKAKVAAGEYVSESEVIRVGLSELLARDQAFETWLDEEVVPAYRAIKADPSSALSGEDMRAWLAEKHSATLKNA
jgi:Arc/MetJ-type ribon-helix-helix transcriptional regulator